MAKGTVLDIATGSFFLFGAVLIIFISYTFVTSFNDAASNIPSLNNTEALDALESSIELFDTGFILLFFGVTITIIIGSYLLNANPLFMIGSIILWAFLIIVVAQASNMYYGVSQASAFSDALAAFPIIDGLMKNLPILFSIVAIIAIVALYIQSKRSDFI